MGNHDGAALGLVDAADFNPDARRAIEWTATVLDPNGRAYLAALPEVRVSGELTAVHGSPRDPTWEYVTSTAVAAANLSAFDTWLCLHGHTHIPAVFRAGSEAVTLEQPPARATVALDARRALVNPGSVGQPRDGNPESAYAILDDGGSAEFRRVPYDIERTQKLMRTVDLPQRLVERLSWGR